MENILIRSMIPEDWEWVKKIYESGIETGVATFELKAPDWNKWNTDHLPFSRLVAIEKEILGWAALTPVSNRCVYGGVAEVSVYVSQNSRRKRIGKKLLATLVMESEKNGIWTLQAGIFAENIASIKLHEAVGFRLVGYRERIGKLQGVWKNTVLMERRSNTVET